MDEYKDEEKKDLNEGGSPEVQDKKPEGSVKPDEKKDEGSAEGKTGKKARKDNVYDQYRYWGSDRNDKDSKLKLNGRNRFTLFIFLALIISFAFLFFNQSSGQRATEVSYSAFKSALEAGSVTQVDIQDEAEISFITANGFYGVARIPYYDSSLMGI